MAMKVLHMKIGKWCSRECNASSFMFSRSTVITLRLLRSVMMLLLMRMMTDDGTGDETDGTQLVNASDGSNLFSLPTFSSTSKPPIEHAPQE